MKVAVTLSCCLVLAFVASAQGAKKFTSLSDLSSHFEEAEEAATKKINAERLAALEAFVADKANEKSPDLGEARMATARLALALDKYDVAKKNAEVVAKDPAAEVAMEGKAVLITATAKAGGATAAQLKEALDKFLADAPPEAVNLAYEAASSTAEALVDLDDLAAAKEAWKALGEKVTHPQIARVVAKATADLEEVGKDPKPFPEAAKDTAGNALSIEKLKGKVVLLDFWATWCGPCVAELPNVIAAYRKYHPKGFEIIGISLDDEDKAKLDKFLAGHPGMKWPQFYDGKGWKNEIAVLYGVKSIPATYLLDQNGKVYRTGLRGQGARQGHRAAAREGRRRRRRADLSGCDKTESGSS